MHGGRVALSATRFDRRKPQPVLLVERGVSHQHGPARHEFDSAMGRRRAHRRTDFIRRRE